MIHHIECNPVPYIHCDSRELGLSLGRLLTRSRLPTPAYFWQNLLVPGNYSNATRSVRDHFRAADILGPESVSQADLLADDHWRPP